MRSCIIPSSKKERLRAVLKNHQLPGIFIDKRCLEFVACHRIINMSGADVVFQHGESCFIQEGEASASLEIRGRDALAFKMPNKGAASRRKPRIRA